jgi:hypothetical protein
MLNALVLESLLHMLINQPKNQVILINGIDDKLTYSKLALTVFMQRVTCIYMYIYMLCIYARTFSKCGTCQRGSVLYLLSINRYRLT